LKSIVIGRPVGVGSAPGGGATGAGLCASADEAAASHKDAVPRREKLRTIPTQIAEPGDVEPSPAERQL
jgi:hypothetical protein